MGVDIAIGFNVDGVTVNTLLSEPSVNVRYSGDMVPVEILIIVVQVVAMKNHPRSLNNDEGWSNYYSIPSIKFNTFICYLFFLINIIYFLHSNPLYLSIIHRCYDPSCAEHKIL